MSGFGNDQSTSSDSADLQDGDDILVTLDGRTDIGQVREVNQDQFLVGRMASCLEVTASGLPEEVSTLRIGNLSSSVMMVADGMGGHAAGEEASLLAIKCLADQISKYDGELFADSIEHHKRCDEGLTALFRRTHSAILKQSEKNPEQEGMGTTLTMARIAWPWLHVVHAGDSRCYLIRDGRATQLTKDHTLARKLVDAGEMKPEDEAESRWSNVLWNVLGGQLDDDLLVEIRRVELMVGDSIVVCSDGLHRYVDQELLAMTVCESDDLNAVCRELIRLANEAGGDDNITVTIARCVETRRSTGQTTLIEETSNLDSFETLMADDSSFGDRTSLDTTMDEGLSTDPL